MHARAPDPEEDEPGDQGQGTGHTRDEACADPGRAPAVVARLRATGAGAVREARANPEHDTEGDESGPGADEGPRASAVR